MKARYLREYVSEQDNKRERVKPQVAPIHVELDSALAKVAPLLEADENSVPGRLYRGWAKMFKAQLHELAYEHWSAGQSAKAGKGDLDRVLEADPNNPDALMAVGTYLYSRGSLTGRRQVRELAPAHPAGGSGARPAIPASSPRSGAAGPSTMRVRCEAPSCSGSRGASRRPGSTSTTFDADFPDNPRLIEPVAIIGLFLPDRLGADLPRIRRVVVDANEGADDRLTIGS